MSSSSTLSSRYRLTSFPALMVAGAAANMSCRHGQKVAFKARKKFRNARQDCFMRTDAKIYRGNMRTIYRDGA